MVIKSRLAAAAAKRNSNHQGAQLYGAFEDWYNSLEWYVRENIRYALVGGSAAKGTSDLNSDIDASLIVYETEDVLQFLNSQYPTLCVGRDGREVRFDLHIIKYKFLADKVDDFVNARNLSYELQDLLWNIRFGFYVNSRPELLIETISRAYDQNNDLSVRSAIKYRLGLMTEEIRKSLLLLEGDYLQIFETQVRLMKLSLLYSYFYLGEGFWGYKNTQYIIPDLPSQFRNIFLGCMSCIEKTPQSHGKLLSLVDQLQLDCN